MKQSFFTKAGRRFQLALRHSHWAYQYDRAEKWRENTEEKKYRRSEKNRYKAFKPGNEIKKEVIKRWKKKKYKMKYHCL